MTVYEVKVADGSEGAQRIAEPDTTFVVADIKACPEGGSGEFPYSEVILQDAESRSWTFWNVQIGAMEPNLTDAAFDEIPEGECRRGWLTFEVSDDTKPDSITVPDTDSGESMTWPAS